MSYAIVRMQKFQKSGVKGIQIHDNREKPSRTNPDIDTTRTPENYSLHSGDGGYANRVQRRIDESLGEKAKSVRSDAVVMYQILITSGPEFFKDMTPEKEKAFFQQSLQFISDRYGRENVVSATVHKDEKTPHMHVNLVPIVEGSRLSAKALFSRKELVTLHDAFHASVGQSWGLQRGESREEKRRHLDTESFKQKTRKEQLTAQKEQLTAEEKRLTAAAKEIDAIRIRSKIQPDDLTPEVLERGIFGTVAAREAPETVAMRLTEKYITPLEYRAAKLEKELGAARQWIEGLREKEQKLEAYEKGLTEDQKRDLRSRAGTLRDENEKAAEQKREQKRLQRQVEQQQPTRGWSR